MLGLFMCVWESMSINRHSTTFYRALYEFELENYSVQQKHRKKVISNSDITYPTWKLLDSRRRRGKHLRCCNESHHMHCIVLTGTNGCFIDWVAIATMIWSVFFSLHSISLPFITINVFMQRMKFIFVFNLFWSFFHLWYQLNHLKPNSSSNNNGSKKQHTLFSANTFLMWMLQKLHAIH